jgi:hypothetical protein
MSVPYLGLSAAEFDDINEAVAEAMAFVVLPVQFFRAEAATVDPLYGEATDGVETWPAYGPPVKTSTRIDPTGEELTRRGLKTGAHLMGFIPTRYREAWELETGEAFVLDEAMELTFAGKRYNVLQVKADPLPMGDGSTSNTLGIVFTAETKPRRGA